MPFESQIAGHGCGGDPQKAILKRPEDGRLLKPVQAPPRGQREIDFYNRIFSSDSKDSTDKKIRRHVPHFYGVEEYPAKKFEGSLEKGRQYIVLQDLTEGFEEPNILDIKIGATTYGPDAIESKKLSEDSKYIGTKHPFGFSVLGMNVHPLTDNKTNNGLSGLLKLDRTFGLTLKSNEISSVPEIFFDFKNRIVPELVVCVVKQIKEIRKTFKKQRKYKIYASSVLIVYDARAVKNFVNGKLSSKKLSESVIVKIIDFAHVFPSNGEKDENFLFGLENIYKMFKNCLKKGVSDK